MHAYESELIYIDIKYRPSTNYQNMEDKEVGRRHIYTHVKRAASSCELNSTTTVFLLFKLAGY
jgi:hypothetical protein